MVAGGAELGFVTNSTIERGWRGLEKLSEWAAV